jgi:hypothetical protein
MRKSNKKRDQKRSAKARKQVADKVAAQKQKDQYDAGFMRAIERDRERMRRKRNQVNPFTTMYGATAMQAGAMEALLASMEREDAQKRLMRQMYDKQIDLQVGLAADAATFLGGKR